MSHGSKSTSCNASSLLPVASPTLSVWQTSHQTPIANFHSTPELPAKTTVVIIGSGITAAFAVRELLSTSPQTDVLVLEARGTCSGATGRNGGHLMPLIFAEEPDVRDFELRNFNQVAKMIEQENIPCDFRRLNSVIGFWNSVYFEEAKEKVESFQKNAPEFANLVMVVEDQQELKSLRLKDANGAIVQSTAATLSPYKLVTWMWEDMLKHHSNLNLQTDTAVTEIRCAAKSSQAKTEWVVNTTHGSVFSEYILLATNGYTAHLLPQFRDLITPVQLTMSALRPPPSSPLKMTLIDHSYSMMGVGPMDRIQNDYLSQQPLKSGGQLMFGGGRAVIKGNGVGVCDDSFVDENARRYLREQLVKLLDLGAQGNQDEVSEDTLESDGEWTGIPGYSRDQRPWVGGVPGMVGVFLSAGYTGHGG